MIEDLLAHTVFAPFLVLSVAKILVTSKNLRYAQSSSSQSRRKEGGG